jgi:hypothetical protein
MTLFHPSIQRKSWRVKHFAKKENDKLREPDATQERVE